MPSFSPSPQPHFRTRAQKKIPFDLRAAQYLRASTQNQIYSIANQRDAISEYAAQNGLTIVRTYSDPARTGVTLRNRKGLRRLISDVESGKNNFNTIIVFDVSRWGRFQDTDESAHYEFLCKMRGVTVRYCAEPFDNTTTLTNNVLKNMKRAMAGEYSRDLSARVHRGQMKLAAMGFHQGGVPSFGFRRLVVDEKGKPKGLIERDEYKYLASDRVVLVHGPIEEIESVREIFRLFVETNTSRNQIARLLNSRGIRNSRGNPWNGTGIDKLLRCEKYIGNVIYNKTSIKLGVERIENPEALWARASGAIPPIVSEKLFYQAQMKLANVWALSDNDLLDYLSAFWCRHGYLSSGLIDRSPLLPSANTFIEHFGSLGNGYRLIGYKPAHKYRYRGVADLLRRLDQQVTAQIISDLTVKAKSVSLHQFSHVIEIDQHLKVAVIFIPFLSRGGPIVTGWKLHLSMVPPSHAVLVVRLNNANTLIKDFHLIPRSSFLQPTFRFTDSNIYKFESYKLPSLSDLYAVYQHNWFSVPYYTQELSPYRSIKEKEEGRTRRKRFRSKPTDYLARIAAASAFKAVKNGNSGE